MHGDVGAPQMCYVRLGCIVVKTLAYATLFFQYRLSIYWVLGIGTQFLSKV